MEKIELLAPAGDLETVKTASRFGADAVYIGGPLLQLRADRAAFSPDDIGLAADYLHCRGKRLYVAVNSFAKNTEIGSVADYVNLLKELGVDAVIVSDLGVLAEVKASVPTMEVHVSTQANCQNYRAAQVYHTLGASRIVLARELSLAEIADLRANVPDDLVLEAFIHGAMCMAYSGRCLLSAYLTGRSGNRGECAQSCRWNYHLVEETRPGEYFPIEADPDGTAILSSHDLCCISFLDQILDAGVTSLKIEGRMKTPYYVATVTNAYRRALDRSASMQALESELEAISHRPYSSGFYFGELKTPAPNDGRYRQSCRFVGVVKRCAGRRVVVEQRNRFSEGETLEVLSPHSMGLRFEAKHLEDRFGTPIVSAPHAQEEISMDCPFSLSEGDFLRVRAAEVS